MRVCVVGSGAVGSLFAANLAQLDDVEVWAYDLSQPHVDAINANGLRLIGAERGRRARAGDDRSIRAASLRVRHRRDEGDAHRGSDCGDGACILGRRGGVGTERDRQRGGHRRARLTGHTRNHVPGREDPRAGCRAVGRQRRYDARPVRAESGHGRRDRATRRPPARVAACRRRRWPMRAQPSGARSSSTRRRIPSERSPVSRMGACASARTCAALVSGLVDEGKAVAAAQGIMLDADPEDLIDHAARPDVAYDHKASMLQDVEARRRDRDRLPERRDRALRPRARRADSAERCESQHSSRDWRTHGSTTERRARAALRQRSRRDGQRTSSMRSSSRGASTRDSKVRSRTCPDSRSSIATPTSSCRPTESRASSSRPKRGTSASTGRRRSSRCSTIAPASTWRRPGSRRGLEARRRLRARLRDGGA